MWPAVVAVGVLTLSACGGADQPGAAPAAGTSAAPVEEAAAEPTPSEPAESASAADLVELSEEIRAAQLEQGTAHVEMTYGGELAEAAGLDATTQQADFRFGTGPDDQAMKLSMVEGGTAMEVVVLDGTLYLNMADTGGAPEWVSIVPDEIGQDDPLAEMIGVIADSVGSMDVAAQTELTADAVTSFEHTGTEQVDGQDVDVYEVLIDASKLPAASGGTDPVAAGAVAAGVLGEMSMAYRVSPEGLLLSVDTITAVDGQDMTMTMTYSGWGEPVSIEAPPADQVTDWQDLMAG